MQIHGRFFLLALAMASVSLASHAQNGVASKPDINRCTDWVKATVSDTMNVDAAEFCAGLRQEKNPSLGGWHIVGHCGPATKPSTDGNQPFCASSGLVAQNFAIAAGFRSAAADGGDLIPQNADAAGAAATFYTVTPVQIGQLHLAAGLYRLTLSLPADGWKMTVASEAGKEIGTVSLTPAKYLTYTGSGLSIGLTYSGFRCKDPVNIHELSFTYGGKELYACMRPDHIPPGGETVAAQ